MFLFAKRYLLSPKSHSVINIIAGLSLLSLLTPVAAVIVLLSVFNGFGELATSLSTSVDADLRITPSKGQFFNASESEKLQGIDGIGAISLTAEATLLLKSESRQRVLKVRGVDEAFTRVSTIAQHIVDGEFQPQLGELDRLVISNNTAYTLRLNNKRSAMVTLYALSHSPLTSSIPLGNYTQRRAKVAGRFQLDAESEERYAFTSLRLMQQLLGREGEVSAIEIALGEGANGVKVRSQIEQLMGDSFTVKSREELNSSLYSIIKYEKWAIIFISAMVILLASFSLIGALTMLIIEKRKEMNTLRAMGFSWAMIRRIFHLEGALISTVAVAAGATVGIGVSLAQQHWGLVEIPSDSFVVKAYPVVLAWGDVASIVAISLIGSLALSYIVVNRMIK